MPYMIRAMYALCVRCDSLAVCSSDEAHAVRLPDDKGKPHLVT